MSATRRIGLHDWLASLPPTASGHRLVGACGLQRLGTDEIAAVGRHLDAQIFPLIFASARRVTLVTGVWTGADLAFVQAAERWLKAAQVPVTIAALLTVPPAQQIDAALRRGAMAGPAAMTEAGAPREALETLLADAMHLVDLAAFDADPERARRQQAAVLAEHCDMLIAMVPSEDAAQPVEVAELIDWRRHPHRVPVALSTRALRESPAGTPVWTIDPAQEAGKRPPAPPRDDAGDLERLEREAGEALDAGNDLRCHDLVRRAQGDGLSSRRLDYLAVLSLANAGSTELALARYRQISASVSRADEEWLSLEGRLLCDQAHAVSGEAATALYRQAAAAYRSAWALTGGLYPLINAATAFALAQQRGESHTLAESALRLLAEQRPATPRDRYYHAAVEAEAAMLLGNAARAAAALRRVDAELPGNVDLRRRSLAQWRRLCEVQRIDPAILDAVRLPCVVCVPWPATLDTAMLDEVVAIGPDALVCAALTDASALPALRRLAGAGQRLHLALPAAAPNLLQAWRRRHGDDAAAQLETLLLQAHDLSVADGFLDGESAWAAESVAAMATGLSRLLTRRLGCAWRSFGPLEGPARPTPIAGARYGRRFVGTLFADFAGFTRLDDELLPQFWSVFSETIAALHTRYGEAILYQRTWGDAVHVVAADAATTAAIALDLRAMVLARRAELPAEHLARLELRVAVHHGPVYVDHDAPGGTLAFFGTPLSFAARVEPVTPPGSVFVTEAFAARLETEAPERYSLDYAGEIELPKRYGQFRLFSLRAAG